MRKLLSVCIMIVFTAVFPSFAQNVVLKAPDYFDEPIRDGVPMFPDSLVYDSRAEEIHIPDIMMIGKLGDAGFGNLKKVTFGNIDYVPSALFKENNTIEEIVFEGFVGHFDCTLVMDCPNLRKVIFRGPVSSTGNPVIAYNCPKLDSVLFESTVVCFDLDVLQDAECPNLTGYINHGAFLKVYNDKTASVAAIEYLKSSPRLISDLEKTAQWQAQILTAKNSDYMRSIEYQSARVLYPVLKALDSREADALKAAMDYAWGLGDEVKTKLDILKDSPSYSLEPSFSMTFRYAKPSDRMLKMTRKRFNLDKIAGRGDDISKIKNLLYWIHDNIEHDGSNGLAPGAINLANTYESSRRDSCGYNCRALAICLTEALLAEGIPSRYITCIPKGWESDNDCHVICIAWSQSLNKWVWVDPTLAAYVTDENGIMLHPGEVRYRLQHDLPLMLNEEANWNNRVKQTVSYYLKEYMAKNLYFLETNTWNQAEPEGESNHPQGETVMLIPMGQPYPHADYNTSDEEWFWQAPIME